MPGMPGFAGRLGGLLGARGAALVAAAALVACSHAEPGKAELVDAPATGDVAAYVASEIPHAVRDGKQLLVYVGATWCEPCLKFHAAAAAGQLNADLGDLRFLVFDLDRDEARLATAGYQSQYVPLFAVPRPDGRASGTQHDGVKTDGDYLTQIVRHVRELTPRR